MNMERDIKGMEELHWKVVYMERELEELKKLWKHRTPISMTYYMTVSNFTQINVNALRQNWTEK